MSIKQYSCQNCFLVYGIVETDNEMTDDLVIETKNFKFHSNLDLRKTLLRKFPKYYHEMFYELGKFLSSSPNLPSAIISQCIWFNKKIAN